MYLHIYRAKDSTICINLSLYAQKFVVRYKSPVTSPHLLFLKTWLGSSHVQGVPSKQSAKPHVLLLQYLIYHKNILYTHKYMLYIYIIYIHIHVYTHTHISPLKEKKSRALFYYLLFKIKILLPKNEIKTDFFFSGLLCFRMSLPLFTIGCQLQNQSVSLEAHHSQTTVTASLHIPKIKRRNCIKYK